MSQGLCGGDKTDLAKVLSNKAQLEQLHTVIQYELHLATFKAPEVQNTWEWGKWRGCIRWNMVRVERVKDSEEIRMV